jgi:hypothetical protein
MNLGLGAVSSSALIRGPGWALPYNGVGGVISNVLIANIPQLIFSFLYLAYNGMLTTMCMATEWSRFAIERQGLRVSGQRRGSQRSKYFLSLPYHFSIPLIFGSITMHWLVSQSIFVVDFDVYDYLDDGSRERSPKEENITITCGYSPVAILCGIMAGLVIMAVTVLVGRRKLKSGIPIVGSCSAAIAAACQPGTLENGEETGESEVKWGVMDSGDSIVGHCGFSMHSVKYPEEEKLYA